MTLVTLVAHLGNIHQDTLEYNTRYGYSTVALFMKVQTTLQHAIECHRSEESC